MEELQQEAGDASILVCLQEASLSQGEGSRESEPRNSLIPAAATACSRQLYLERSSLGEKKIWYFYQDHVKFISKLKKD